MNTDNVLTDREVLLRRLSEQRARSPFLRYSGALLLLLVVHAWLWGDFRLTDFGSAQRLMNVDRFLGEIVPRPLQGRPWDWTIALQWLDVLMTTKGWDAAAMTLAISIVAIALAGIAGLVLALPATRTFAVPEPFLPQARVPSVLTRALWSGVVFGTRVFLTFLRAIPEYVWAFLLIAIIGPIPLAAVLALAIHNGGILAKLNAETIENLEAQSLASLRALGATRGQIVLAGIIPAIVPRSLLFLFYRWESCVREATVLGILGIVSLGYYVQDARARQQYDVMLALILLGSGIVMIGDVLSAAAREAVRRSD